MVAKLTDIARVRREIYGISPVPIDPENMPDSIPIEIIQAPTIAQIAVFLRAHLGTSADLLMLSNIPIRYDESNQLVFVAPDYYIYLLAWM